jgi:subtilisin family serine protease
MSQLHSTLLPIALLLVLGVASANGAGHAVTPAPAALEAPHAASLAPTHLRAGVTPAPMYLAGLDWSNYASWDRDQDGDRVDDLVQAVGRDGLSALPAMPDGFVPFEARQGPAGPLVDVWVAYDTGVSSADRAALDSLGIKSIRADPYRPGLWALGVTPTEAGAIAALPGVMMVELEPRFVAFNEVSRGATQVEQTSTYADGVWNDLGYDGTGVGVAVLDTGVDDNHQSLSGRFVAGANTVADCGLYPVEGVNPDDDNAGEVALIGVGAATFHGTHVAGTILGHGAGTVASPGLTSGMAPGADLYDVKVLLGAGLSCTGSVEMGLGWVYSFNAGATLWKSVLGVPASKTISVVSMSLGGGCSNGSDALSATVNALTATGVTSVIAVGNNGLTGCITTPSAAVSAVSVGAYDAVYTISRSDDVHASFSNCGPSIPSPTSTQMDQRKPDVTAPGVNVVSAWGDATPNGVPGSPLYHGLSGTSMATPVVSGIVALMLEKDSTLTPADVKSTLRSTATQPSAYGSTGYQDSTYTSYHTCWGWGQVNAYNAVNSL